MDDAQNDKRYGLECLFRFYSYGLENKIKADVLQDFQHLVLQDYHCNSLYGLEKFWAFLRYRKDKKPIEIIPEVDILLSEFKTINDFRRKEKEMKSPKFQSISVSIEIPDLSLENSD